MLSLHHPNVLMTIGFASDGESRHGIIIELMESGSLYDLLDSDLTLSWCYPLLDIARGVAQGMAYLHDRKVVHRDLKPANVMLGPPPHYRPKVADFGESRRYTGDVTMTVTGTPSFVAPEVLRQERSGPGADVWSFGAMLCHMASRMPPYAALATSTPPYLLMQQVAQGELRPSLEVVGLPWPSQLFEVVTQCEEADPDERPNFQTLVAALGDIPTSNEPAATTPHDLPPHACPACGPGGQRLCALHEDFALTATGLVPLATAGAAAATVAAAAAAVAEGRGHQMLRTSETQRDTAIAYVVDQAPLQKQVAEAETKVAEAEAKAAAAEAMLRTEEEQRDRAIACMVDQAPLEKQVAEAEGPGSGLGFPSATWEAWD